MLDVECSVRGTTESYLSKIRVQHKQNPRLIDTKQFGLRTFGIQHFSGKVIYEAGDFLGNVKTKEKAHVTLPQ